MKTLKKWISLLMESIEMMNTYYPYIILESECVYYPMVTVYPY